MYTNGKWTALLIGCLLIFTSPASSWSEESQGNVFYSTRILDLDVFDQAGEKIGRIDDLVIRRDGSIRHVTIEVGGLVFGIGGKVVDYAFDDLTIGEDRITVDTTRDELEQMDEFNYGERGIPRTYYFGHFPRHPMRGYWPHGYGSQLSPFEEPGSEELPWRGRRPYDQSPGRGYAPELVCCSPPLFLATVVHEQDLIDSMGGRYGRIKDLVINTEGVVERIILEARVLGEGVFISLPFDRLGFTFYGIVYDITLEELEEAPQYPYPFGG